MIFETAIIGRVRVDQYFYYIRRPICVTIFTLVLLSQIFASRHVEAMKNAKTANGQKSSNPKIKSVHIIVTVLTLLLTPPLLYVTMT